MEAEETVGVKARTVLWYLTFIGFAMNYMIRININIAIVDMISSEFKGKGVVMSECLSFVNATNATFYHVSEDVVVNENTFKSLEQHFLDFIGVCCCSNQDSELFMTTRTLIFREIMKETGSSGTQKRRTRFSERFS